MSDGFKDLKALDLLFHGTAAENIDKYLTRFECIAEIAQWSEEEGKRLLLLSLRGDAMNWYLNSRETLALAGPVTLSNLRGALRQQFACPNLEYFSRLELSSIRQGFQEAVSAYASRVQSIGSMAYPSFDVLARGSLMIAPFINGLSDPEIRAMVLVTQPASFTAALTLARNFEAAQGASAGSDELYPAATFDTALPIAPMVRHGPQTVNLLHEHVMAIASHSGCLPIVPIFIESHKVDALLDTGASISLAGKKLLKTLPSRYRVTNVVQHAVTANGKPFTTGTAVELPVRLGRKRMRHTFFLLDEAPFDMIVGTDLIEKSKYESLHFDFVHGRIYLDRMDLKALSAPQALVAAVADPWDSREQQWNEETRGDDPMSAPRQTRHPQEPRWCQPRVNTFVDSNRKW